MKVGKYISGETYTQREDITRNYFLVDDSYDFVGNDMIDVTDRNTLLSFYTINRISYRIYRDSIITTVLPNWNSLSQEEQIDLIYERIYPNTLDDNQLLLIIGDEDEWNTIKNTKTEFEFINEIDEIQKRIYFTKRGEREITSSTSLNTYLELPLVDIPSGTYEISFSLIGGNDKKNRTSEFNFTIDGISVADPIVYTTPEDDNTQSINFSFVQEFSEGSHNVEILYRAIKGNAFISFASIKVDRLI